MLEFSGYSGTKEVIHKIQNCPSGHNRDYDIVKQFVLEKQSVFINFKNFRKIALKGTLSEIFGIFLVICPLQGTLSEVWKM